MRGKPTERQQGETVALLFFAVAIILLGWLGGNIVVTIASKPGGPQTISGSFGAPSHASYR